MGLKIGIDIGIKNNGIAYIDNDPKVIYYTKFIKSDNWIEGVKLLLNNIDDTIDIIQEKVDSIGPIYIEDVIYWGRNIPTTTNLNRVLGALIYTFKTHNMTYILVPSYFTKAYVKKFDLYNKFKDKTKHEVDALVLTKYVKGKKMVEYVYDW